MAMPPRSTRAGDKLGSSSMFIIASSILVGCLLVAVWVMTAPAAIPEDGTLVDTSEGTRSPIDSTPSDDEAVPGSQESGSELTTETQELDTTRFETQVQ